MKQIENISYFIVRKAALSKLLRQLKTNVVNKKNRINTQCELTLRDGEVSFNVPGATFGLKAETIGTAKASFGLEVFSKVVRSFGSKEIKIEIHKDRITINKFSFNASTTFFEDDSILRSIALPINYTDLDLICILRRRKIRRKEIN